MPISKRRAGIAALMTAAGILISSCSQQSTAPAPPPGPLSALIGDNGLYVSGESYSTNQANVSVIDTVYDDLTLKDAGTTAPPLLNNTSATAALKDFTSQNPLWGRWFSTVARSTAAQPASPQDAAGLDGFFHKQGYWADSTQKAGDSTAALATTWTTLQVLAAAGKSPAPNAAQAVKTWLDQQATRISFPVQACQLAQSYKTLAAPAPAALNSYAARWLASHTPSRFKNMQALADTYGAACAATLTHTITPNQQHSLTSLVTPYLAGRTTALQSYYLAEIWLAAGGSKAELHGLAAAALADLNGNGAARGHTVMTGGLVPTFFAVQAQKASGYLDSARIPYITSELAKTNPTHDPVDYLAGAASLCVLKACAAKSSTDIQHAVDQLPRTINAQTMDGYLGVGQFLRAMGRTYPAVTVKHIDASTPEGLHALIMATAAAPASSGFNQALTTQTIRQGLSTHATPWNDPSAVNAAVTVLAHRHALDPATSHFVRSTLQHLSGCAGVQQLYAAQATAESPCDLSTTLSALQTLQLLQA